MEILPFHLKTCIIMCFIDFQQSTDGNKGEEFDHQKGNTTETPSNDVPSSSRNVDQTIRMQIVTTESEASSIEGTFKNTNETNIKLTLDPSNLKNRNLSENEKIIFYLLQHHRRINSFPVTKGRKYSLDWEITYSVVTIFGNREFCTLRLLFSLW